MKRHEKILLLTVMLIALMQMPQMALTPGIEQMVRHFQLSPLAIQATVTLPCLLSALGAIISATLVRFGAITRKQATVAGLLIFGGAGVFMLLFHAAYWNTIVSAIMLGLGLGCFQSNITSIMMDGFDDHGRKLASGMQGAFVSLGGIIMSFVAGLLVTIVWYGGYLILMLALPIGIISLFALPKKKRMHADNVGKLRDLPSSVYLYSIFGSFLFVMTFAAFANNISTHFANAGIENYSVMAGIAIAVNMGGGFIMGLLFRRTSMFFGDYLIGLAFIMMAIGYLIVSIFHNSLPVMIFGSLVIGTAVCLSTPQGIVSMSRYVDESNSFYASMIYACVTNGLAGFLVTPVYTGITDLIRPGDTVFRYAFISGCSIAIAIVYVLIIRSRTRRGVAWR